MLAYRKTTVYKLGQYKSLATLQLFSTFNSFLAGLGRNQVYGASCSAQTTHDQFKPVQKSRKQVLRAYCPNLYIVTNRVVKHSRKEQRRLSPCIRSNQETNVVPIRTKKFPFPICSASGFLQALWYKVTIENIGQMQKIKKLLKKNLIQSEKSDTIVLVQKNQSKCREHLVSTSVSASALKKCNTTAQGSNDQAVW